MSTEILRKLRDETAARSHSLFRQYVDLNRASVNAPFDDEMRAWSSQAWGAYSESMAHWDAIVDALLHAERERRRNTIVINDVPAVEYMTPQLWWR